MDWFLIVASIFLSLVTLAVVVVLIIKFGHPEDKSEIFPKIIVLFGLWLSCVSILIIPLDVANSQSDRLNTLIGDFGGLRVDILWQIVYICIAVFLFLIIPFTFFYYEEDSYIDPSQEKKCCQNKICAAAWKAILFFIIFTIILVIFYSFLNTAAMPVNRIAQQPSLIVDLKDSIPNALPGCNAEQKCTNNEINWNIHVTFPIYVIAFISFWAWFFFCIFAGVGIVALPIDFISDFITRPKKMTFSEYERAKISIGQRADHLLNIGSEFIKEVENTNESKASKKSKSLTRATTNRYEQAVYLLQKELEFIEESYKLKGTSQLWYFLKLILGIIFSILSIIWIVHIAVFNLPPKPILPFLNDFFVDLELAIDGFSLFGVLAFGLFSFYLLLATIKGNFRLGMGIPFLCRVYPMEYNNTNLNAFLVNTWVLLACSVPLVQFCSFSFPVYARFTQLDLMWGNQIKYLEFFKYFWLNNIFLYVFLGVVLFSLIGLFLCPRSKSKDIEQQLANFTKENGQL